MKYKYDPILGVLRESDDVGGADTSDATAVAGDILNGKTAYGSDGKLTGTIPTVTASKSGNVVTVPKGYVKSAQTLTVGTALNAYTITPAANAQVISKDSYLKGEVTVAGDANLTASNIKSGVSIFNVAGTLVSPDTSDATAGAGDILSDKTAYVNGKKVTGTIKSYTGSSLIIPGVADKVLSDANGIYLPKAVKVAGESELLAENIKKGVSIYGIVGTLESGGGTSAEYYKCASVGESGGGGGGGSNTWSGYKAVFDPTAGTWSFESGITAGLAYTNVTPTIGNIYSADAMVAISSLWNGMPAENLVFHLPLNKTTIADIGPDLSASGTIVNTAIDGIPCAYFDGNSRIYATAISMPTGASPRALSLWFRYKDIPSTTPVSGASVLAGWGATASLGRFEIHVDTQELYIIYSSGELKTDIKIQDTNWHHVLIQYDGSTSEIYYDGHLVASEAKVLNTRNDYLYIGDRTTAEYPFDGYLAGIRIYNRVMTSTEIAYLASEFTPTA